MTVKKDFPRETFRKVQESKRKLQQKLETWSQEDKVVTETDKDEFEYLWDTSTLGLAARVPMRTINGWENWSLTKVKRILLESDKKKIMCGKGGEPSYERPVKNIGMLWKALLKRLEEAVFDKALTKALELTPESQLREKKDSKYV